MTGRLSQPLLIDPGAPTLESCTVVRTTDRTLVRRLVRHWHSQHAHTSPGFRAAYLMTTSDGLPLAVAIWTRPIARLEDQAGTLELHRLAHGPNMPRNGGSWFMARMREDLRASFPDVVRLISYQDAKRHSGALYRADNWQTEGAVHSASVWTNRAGRIPGTAVHCRVKWERALR